MSPRKRVQTARLGNVLCILMDDGTVRIETPSWVTIQSWCGSTGSTVELEVTQP